MKTIHRPLGVVISAAMLFGSSRTLAQNVETTQSYCSPDGMTGGFSGSDDVVNGGKLMLTGAAKITPDGKLQLTDSKKPFSQSANVYYYDPLDMSYVDGTNNRPFHTYFSFTIGPITGTNAGAGLSFLMQNNDVGQTGASGAGTGYAGISTSLAIEFDTHRDVPPMGNALYPDPMVDHIGFMLDGKHEEHPAYILPEIDGSPNLTLRRLYVWIDYAGMGDQNVRVYLSATKQKPAMPLVWQLNKNPAPLVPFPTFPDAFNTADWFSVVMDNKPAQAWVGFSAATFNATITNDHVIEEWEFSNQGVPCACQETDFCGNADPTKPACDAASSGVCVECLLNDDCGAQKPVCDTTAKECGQCTKNSDCDRFPNTPLCDNIAGSSTEGECKACETGTVFNPISGTCTSDEMPPGSGSGAGGGNNGTIGGGGLSCAIPSFMAEGNSRAILPLLFGAAVLVLRRRRRA
jgi:Legume lectin domain